MENIQGYDKPGRERSFRGKYQVQDMNSYSEEDILVEDWLTSQQDLLDTSDEELNDDLLRSDDENETIRSHSERVRKPKVQEIAKASLVSNTADTAKDQSRCPKEEHTEVDPGEVLDIEINAPSGDEFQVGSDLQADPSGRDLIPSCRAQSAPEEGLTGPCRSPEPVFPGQHMFDQQHSTSVLDTNPLLAGPAPMGSIQPAGNESDPWRPSPALQGPTYLSKPWTPHRGHCPLQKHPSAESGCSFTARSGSQAQKPAVLVRAVARMVQSAKPMAVARGMPIAARHPASAKSKISAKTLPAPGMVGRNVGQKVKVDPKTPPVTQKLPAKPLNMANNKESEEEVLYMQRIKEQTRLREQVIKQKERMRSLRAVNNKHLPLQTDSSAGHWYNSQNQQTQPCILSPRPRKVTHKQVFHNPSHCLFLEHHPEFQHLPPQQHHYQILAPALQLPWQKAPLARGSPSGHAAETQHNQPHQWGTDRVVLQGTEQVPDQMDLQCRIDEAHAAGPQEVWQGGKRMFEQTCEGPMPTKIRVVKDFSPGRNEETKAVTETKPRTVTFRMPDSSPPVFLQHRLKLNCSTQNRGSSPNEPQDKVAVRENQRSAFIPFSSGQKMGSVTAQTCVSFIVRLNH